MRLTEPPRRLAEIRPEVPWSPAVQAVMDHALQRDAALRYASASEFGRALSAAVRQQPVSFPADATSATPEPVAAEPTVPPTRVSESAGPRASSAAPVEVTRQRWPLMATAGVLVVVLVVAGLLFSSARKAGSGGTTTATQSAGEAPPAPGVGTPAPSSGPAADAAVKPSAAPADPIETGPVTADPRATPPSSARSRSGGETPATSRSSPETVTDVSARIPVLLEQSRDDETTISARREAANLLPLARGAQVVALKLVQVRSYAMKNEDARACDILQGLQQQSRGTEYEPEVTRLLESCPR